MARHVGGLPAKSPKTVDVAAWARPKTARKRSKGVSDACFLKTFDDLREFLASGKIDRVEGKHFVALFADLYCRVYGIPPEDLGPAQRVYASKLAKDMLEKDFGGDREAMAKFVSWTWTREKEREEWRRANAVDGGRVSWAFQFNRRLLSEYRLSVARTRPRELESTKAAFR